MKGIVFKLFEAVVTRDYGELTWDAVLEEAGIYGAYTAVGSYPDDDLIRLVKAASVALGLSQNDVIRWFGRTSLPLLAESYPQFFTRHESVRPFLLTLNDIIHPEVRKLYPGAEVPRFEYDDSAADVLVMSYQSDRGLCSFGEGLIEGAATHYGEKVAIHQPECVKRGDRRCLMEIRFDG